VRIVDASLNRAAEGLRVCEDYVRFVLGDTFLSGELKLLRHDLSVLAQQLPASWRHASRWVAGDVGTSISVASERVRSDPWDVCCASFERTKQAMRSVEEFGKTFSPTWAAQCEPLRYRLYDIEMATSLTVDSRDRLASVRLCVLLDGGTDEAALARLAAELIDAGVEMIQLRDKQLDDRQLVLRGRQLCALAAAARRTSTDVGGPPVIIINDRPDLAVATGADGVHVGQDDLTVADARRVLGPTRLVGVSTHSLTQARQAVRDGANYLGVGPVFPSSTKHFESLAGLDLVREVSQEIRLPAFAIGGIDLANLSQVVTQGGFRIAVGAAVSRANRPAEALTRLRQLLTASPGQG
jgi:thiamine-phosphate pyrophosphorylase